MSDWTGVIARAILVVASSAFVWWFLATVGWRFGLSIIGGVAGVLLALWAMFVIAAE